MGAAEKLYFTLEEYLALEEEGEKYSIRHEFHDGEIFIISDSSIAHNQALMGAIIGLTTALKDKPCQVVTSTQKVHVQTESFYCYPDIVVVCDPIETLEGHKDIITNPTLLIEILSPFTMDYDRGEKFRLYRNIPTLEEYICISSLQVSVEKYTRQNSTQWLFEEYTSINDIVTIEKMGISLSLAGIYEKVDFSLNA
ncbi:Uma2 family endonuclease [Parasediminibacterium sp. JCM 36343]|uniref:Uma2 family endonuclease n=1 Tax=Parasediminibacterium sp. JCM 36343 TaxID=3374279 RepID=UPI003978F413